MSKRLVLFASVVIAVLAVLASPSTSAAQVTPFQILTTPNGLGQCDPQLAQNNPVFSGNCCGAPGRSYCSGVGLPWVQPTGCTLPTTNQLVDPSELASLCDLPATLPEKTDLLPEQRPESGTDFQFWVASDLHFYRNWYNVYDQSNFPNRMNQIAADPNFTWSTASEKQIKSFETGPIGPPTAVLVPGDLMLGGEVYQLEAYRLLWESNWLNPGSINFPVYFGLGNHDNSDRMRKYLYDRTLNMHVDRNGTGCLVDITPGCFDEGNDGGTLQYSWDWHGVHFIMVGPNAGSIANLDTQPADGADGFTWLANDLAHYVGHSGRPVVILQHYDFGHIGPSGDWPSSDFHKFWTIIRDYNIIALFSGHSHALSMYSPSDFITSTSSILPIDMADYLYGNHTTKHLDDYVDGNGGDCHNQPPNGPNEGCSGAHPTFMAAHISDNYLDVGALGSEDSNPAPGNLETREVWVPGYGYSVDLGQGLTDPTKTIGGYGGFGPSGNDTVCRKRINTKFVSLPSHGSIGIGGVYYTGTSRVNGTFAVRIPLERGNYDFVDSCDTKEGSPYVLIPEQTLNPGDLITDTGYRNLDGATLVQLQDLVLHTNASPAAVTLSDKIVNVAVTTSRPGEEITYKVGNLPKWAEPTDYQQTTPATLGFLAKGPFAPGVEVNSVVLTPTDPTLNPTYVPLTLSVQGVEFKTSPENLSVVVDGTRLNTPARLAWISGSQHNLEAVGQPGTPGSRYVFSSWSDQGAWEHQVTASSYSPAGSVYQATFNHQYLVSTSVTPANGGTVTAGGWALAGSTASIIATPAPGYAFAGFTGTFNQQSASLSVALNEPIQEQANFVLLPSLSASAGPARRGTQPGQIVVPVILQNQGPGNATGLTMTIGSIQVLSGSGSVTLTSGPLQLGNLSSGSRATGNAQFDWPASARTIQFTVNWEADGGLATGQSVITLRR